VIWEEADVFEEAAKDGGSMFPETSVLFYTILYQTVHQIIQDGVQVALREIRPHGSM
jgi:hypothetical protein